MILQPGRGQRQRRSFHRARHPGRGFSRGSSPAAKLNLAPVSAGRRRHQLWYALRIPYLL